MKTVINIKADVEVKKNAQKLAEEIGLSLSAVLNAYLKQFIRNREINLSIVPRMSQELETFLGEVEQDIRKKKNFSPPFSTMGEARCYLDSL
ncbi:MAG: hypothetical protein Q7N87_00890 [Candidatus Uhrbacteria bacterium]|nr:hypothetical protein [Candidatus Uhrbacteria bacterium]